MTAARNKTGNYSRRSAFRSAQPWKSGDPKQIRRWNDFVRLDARIKEWGADFREFVSAAMDYFSRCKRGFLPNPRQVSGPVGKQVWETWRKKRQAEGNMGIQGEQRVEAAAFLATQSAETALRNELRSAYEACRDTGPDLAPTLLWGAEVLWLMWTTEPATRFGIKGQFAQLREDEKPGWGRAWRRITGDRWAQERLLALRREVVQTDKPILEIVPEDEGWVHISTTYDPSAFAEETRAIKRAEWVVRDRAGAIVRRAREREQEARR